MKIWCPCCGDCFEPNEDDVRWDYSEEANYNDPAKFVWEDMPLLRSSWENNHESARECQVTGDRQ